MYLSTGAGLELLPRALTAAGPKFLEDQFKAKSSGTRCQVSRVTDMAGHEATGPLPFQEEESEFVPIASRSLRFALVSVRYREWNCSCSNGVMQTLAHRDPLTLKEQT